MLLKINDKNNDVQAQSKHHFPLMSRQMSGGNAQPLIPPLPLPRFSSYLKNRAVHRESARCDASFCRQRCPKLYRPFEMAKASTALVMQNRRHAKTLTRRRHVILPRPIYLPSTRASILRYRLNMHAIWGFEPACHRHQNVRCHQEGSLM